MYSLGSPDFRELLISTPIRGLFLEDLHHFLSVIHHTLVENAPQEEQHPWDGVGREAEATLAWECSQKYCSFLLGTPDVGWWEERDLGGRRHLELMSG